MTVKATKHNGLFLDFLTLLLGRAVGQVLTIAVGLLLVRLLAPRAFGDYSLATTTIGLAGVLVDFGLDVILTRTVATQPHAAPALLRQAIAIRALLGGLVTSLLVAIALITPILGRPDLLLIGGLGLLPRGAYRAISATLTGLGHIRYGTYIETATLSLSSILTAFLVLVNLPLFGDLPTAAMWGLTLGSVAGAVLALRRGLYLDVGFHLDRASPATARPTARRLLRAALPFTLTALAGAAFQSLDIYIVGGLYRHIPDAVALYAAPFRVLNLLLLVPTAWGVAALPRYARGESVFGRDLRSMAFVGLVLSAACSRFAEPLTGLVLGPNYAASAGLLAVLGWMVFPVCLSAPLIARLTVADRGAWITACVLLAGGLATGANVLLAGLSGPGAGLYAVAGVKVGAMVVLLGLYTFALTRSAAQNRA